MSVYVTIVAIADVPPGLTESVHTPSPDGRQAESVCSCFARRSAAARIARNLGAWGPKGLGLGMIEMQHTVGEVVQTGWIGGINNARL